MSAAGLPAVLCVGAVAVRAGALLLVRRGRDPAAGEWSVPGGRVEPGENLAQAVVRELREETGLEGMCGTLLGCVERVDGEVRLVILDFEVAVTGSFEPRPGGDAVEAVTGSFEPRPGGDAVEAEWVELHEVTARPLVEGLAEFLREHGVINATP